MKAEIIIRIQVVNEIGYLRLLYKNADGKTLFDKTGISDTLPQDVMTKINALNDEMIIVMLEEQFKNGLEDISFAKIDNNIK